jgi:hypothetical protein
VSGDVIKLEIVRTPPVWKTSIKDLNKLHQETSNLSFNVAALQKLKNYLAIGVHSCTQRQSDHISFVLSPRGDFAAIPTERSTSGREKEVSSKLITFFPFLSISTIVKANTLPSLMFFPC